WAYANSTDNAWGSIVKNWGAGATGRFHRGLGRTAENTLQNHLNTGPATATDPFPLEQWVHTAFVADSAAGQHRLYMTGVVVATAAYAGTLVPGAATGLGIGVKPTDDGTTTVSNAPGFWNG